MNTERHFQLGSASHPLGDISDGLVFDVAWVMLGSDRVSDVVCNCLSARKPDMDVTQPRAVITHYFDLMGRGEDFATCYAEDVSWTTLDSGTVVSGPTEVRDYLTELHRNMPDVQTRPIAYADEAAYVEGDCADPRGASTDRIPFCIAYDIAHGVITAARCYGAIGFLAPEGRVGSASVSS